MADDEQSSLITALKQRDRAAWGAAVDRHLHEVYGFVFHLVGGDRTVAEDLNQETWLEALDGIDQCNAAQGSFRNWLFGVARNRVALHYRRRTLAGSPMPAEEDLLRALRMIAEQRKGEFPEKLGMNTEVMGLSDVVAAEFETDKLEAELDKLLAKYGGKEKLRAKYGKEIPPEIMAEVMKAAMPLIQEQMPLMQQRMQGITFYEMLQLENDPHYVGGGVKLGTPHRPILWYKPTGADKYRVIYADLSVKEMTPADVKKLSEAEAK